MPHGLYSLLTACSHCDLWLHILRLDIFLQALELPHIGWADNTSVLSDHNLAALNYRVSCTWLQLLFVVQIAWLWSYHKFDSVNHNLRNDFPIPLQELVAKLSHSMRNNPEEVESAMEDMVVLQNPGLLVDAVKVCQHIISPEKAGAFQELCSRYDLVGF